MINHLLGDWGIIALLAGIIFAMWCVGGSQKREAENWLLAELADAGWDVKEGGGSLARLPFRIYRCGWLNRLFFYMRPLMIKQSDDLTAWLAACSTSSAVLLGVQFKNRAYPAVVLRKWKSFGFS